MSSGPGVTPDPTPTPEETLRRARQRFVDGFPDRAAGLGALVRGLAAAPDTSTNPLRVVAHRLAGLAGTIAFPTVGEHAARIEALSEGTPFDAMSAGEELDLMQAAFERERAILPEWWAADEQVDTSVVWCCWSKTTPSSGKR